jgi:hypothetical protein
VIAGIGAAQVGADELLGGVEQAGAAAAGAAIHADEVHGVWVGILPAVRDLFAVLVSLTTATERSWTFSAG